MLKAGLTRLKETIKTHKDTLSKHPFNKECISEEDEHWLDNEANFVDEDAVIDLLDKASDYEHGLEHLRGQTILPGGTCCHLNPFKVYC